jgi:CO dehydrogenase/acetyl-CoA synthase gamma subunit (corrinoid Fe-S protein)
MEKKICRTCQAEKTENDFYRSKGFLNTNCKKCHNKQRGSYYTKKNPEERNCKFNKLKDDEKVGIKELLEMKTPSMKIVKFHNENSDVKITTNNLYYWTKKNKLL